MLAGAFLGLRGVNKSLWLDEAWVANSLLAGSLRGMLLYDRWLQTSPPLFLLTARAAVRLFGEKNWAFHLAPLLFAWAALGVFARVARQRLAAGFAVLAVALFALSPAGLYYARELKQYSAELFAGTVLLWLSFAARRRGGLRLRWAIPALLVCIGLGYGAVVFLPGFFLAQAGRLDPSGKRGPLRWKGLLLLFGTVLVAFGILAVQVESNTSPLLHEFWFGEGAGSTGAQARGVEVYSGVLLALLPGGDALVTLERGAEAALLSLVGLCIAGILAARIESPPRQRETMTTLGLCGLPVLGMLMGSLLEVYPWSLGTCLALLPCLGLGIVALVQAVARAGVAAPGPSPCAALRLWLARLAAGLAALIALIALSTGTRRALAPVLPVEDVEGSVRFLERTVKPQDLLYVHASLAEPFRLYTHVQGWAAPEAVFGHTAWPCCARGATRRETAAEIVARHDLATQVPPGFRGSVWAVYTARADHWQYVGVDEPRLMADDMAGRGCRLVQDLNGVGVVVRRFSCGL